MYGNTKLAIMPTLPTLCVCEKLELQFSSLFAPTDASKYEITSQWVYEDFISRLNTSLD